MRKKLQVFISSTYVDLLDERQAAVQAVLDAGHIPAGMELFKAGNRTQLETIYRWIDDSDVFMLILGDRYGSIEEESGKSYTHLEYEYAMQSGKPVFAVILSDSFLKTKESVEVGNSKKSQVQDYQENLKYKGFKELVMSKIIRLANDSKDIMLVIHTTLKEFLEEYDLIGWVRGDDTEANTSLLLQNNNLNNENRNLREKCNIISKKLEDYQISFEESLAFEGKEIEILGTYQEPGSKGPSGIRKQITRTIQKAIFWDEMYLLWAPRLLATLNTIKAKQELEWALKDFVGRYFSINDNLFNKIKIQYYALGLIDMYEAKTTAGGTAEFVKLTQKGKGYLIQNTAEYKEALYPPPPE